MFEHVPFESGVSGGVSEVIFANSKVPKSSKNKKKNPDFVSSLLEVSTFYSTSDKCSNFQKDQDQTRISASRIS